MTRAWSRGGNRMHASDHRAVLRVRLSCKIPSDVLHVITLYIHERAPHQEVLRL